MKRIVYLFLLLSVSISAQSINNYKYVIVPIKYDFLGENDRYNLNTISKLMLQKYGFVTLMDNEELPLEVAENRCKSLFLEAVSEKNMFLTKLKFKLKDCRNNILFETDFGTSREKENRTAYNEALREAAKDFEKIKYHYVGDLKIVPEQSLEMGETYYFAQQILNGFQVVDITQKVVLKLLKTSHENIFVGIKENVQGVVILKGSQCVFEYYQEDSLISEKLNIKF